MSAMYSVTVAIIVNAGSRDEQPDAAGCAHMIEHMLFKGTKRRPRAEIISETIERVGGVLNASTDKELTTYWAKVGREHAALALDLLTDMLRESLLDVSEIEKERRVVLEELSMSMDTPQEWVHMLADERCWPGTSLGRDIAGTPKRVAALTRQQLTDFHRAYYVPASIVVAIAGGIGHDEALAIAGSALGNWSPAAAPPASEPVAYVGQPPTVFYERRSTEQVNLCLAARGVPRTSDDRYAFELLTMILGGSTSSRLFLEIRERRGLAYDIHSYDNMFADTASLVTYAAVAPKQAIVVVREVLRQMADLRTTPVPESELAKVKESFKGHLLLGLEDTQSVAAWCGVQQALTGAIRQPEEVCRDVDRVDADDIRRIAEDCFQTQFLRLAILGPRQPAPGMQAALAL